MLTRFFRPCCNIYFWLPLLLLLAVGIGAFLLAFWTLFYPTFPGISRGKGGLIVLPIIWFGLLFLHCTLIFERTANEDDSMNVMPDFFDRKTHPVMEYFEQASDIMGRMLNILLYAATPGMVVGFPLLIMFAHSAIFWAFVLFFIPVLFSLFFFYPLLYLGHMSQHEDQEDKYISPQIFKTLREKPLDWFFFYVISAAIFLCGSIPLVVGTQMLPMRMNRTINEALSQMPIVQNIFGQSVMFKEPIFVGSFETSMPDMFVPATLITAAFLFTFVFWARLLGLLASSISTVSHRSMGR